MSTTAYAPALYQLFEQTKSEAEDGNFGFAHELCVQGIHAVATSEARLVQYFPFGQLDAEIYARELPSTGARQALSVHHTLANSLPQIPGQYEVVVPADRMALLSVRARMLQAMANASLIAAFKDRTLDAMGRHLLLRRMDGEIDQAFYAALESRDGDAMVRVAATAVRAATLLGNQESAKAWYKRMLKEQIPQDKQHREVADRMSRQTRQAERFSWGMWHVQTSFKNDPYGLANYAVLPKQRPQKRRQRLAAPSNR